MPESVSLERRKVLKQLGADVVLTPAAEGMKGAIAKAEQLLAESPNAFTPQQFRNPQHRDPQKDDRRGDLARHGRPGRHPRGRRRYRRNITGVGEVLKPRKPSFRCIAVEPATSAVITQARAKQPLKPGPHKIQGLGAGFIPDNLHLDIIDDAVQIADEDAFAWARRAAREEGILCGISSGAALYAAEQVANRPENRGKLIVAIMPSAGERYLSTALFEAS